MNLMIQSLRENKSSNESTRCVCPRERASVGARSPATDAYFFTRPVRNFLFLVRVTAHVFQRIL